MKRKAISGVAVAAALFAASILIASVLAHRNAGFRLPSKPSTSAVEKRRQPRIAAEKRGPGNGAPGGEQYEGRAGGGEPVDRDAEYRKRLDEIARKHLGREVERGDGGVEIVALTFDAGAASDSTPMILDALKKRGVKATFFLTGKWVEQNPRLAKRIVDEGHEVGNHTYSHPKLTSMSDEEVLKELLKAEETIRRITGKNPRPFFRAPFGARDRRILDVIAKRGYFSVYWTVDSFDWKEGITESEVKGRIFSAISPGAIILSHAGSSVQARALPSVLDEIGKRGLKAGRLSDVLAR